MRRPQPGLTRGLVPLLGLLGCVCGGAAAASGPTVPLDERLPRAVVPTFQSIRLDLDASKPDYRGSVRIELDVREATDTIRFHAREMKLTRVTLHGRREAVTPAIAFGERGGVTATVPSPLAPGPYTLEIEFENEYDSQAVSLYRAEVGGERYLFTQFEADDARGAFPCWDEPSFKQPFQLTLIVPESDLAVSNTPIEREEAAGGRRTVVFRRTRPLPAYLLALAAGPLETVPLPGFSIPGRVVTVRGASHLAGEAVRMAPPILAALERYFGEPYPYEKLDLIAVPEFWPGGMENPGAITFSDGILLLDPKTAGVAQRRLLARVLAHEMAHMWFGDVVTMAWWDDFWLNESFAEWMGDAIADEVFPDLGVGIHQLEDAQAAYATDALPATRALRQPVVAIDNLLQIADELAYQKGQIVLGMFEHWLGKETFRRGVLDYIAAHRWGNAVAADLWGALSRASGRDVGAALNTFLDQPGAPRVRVEALGGGRLKVSQSRFLNHGLTEDGAARWRIPIALKYSDGGAVRVERMLLVERETVLDLPGGGTPLWIHPNAEELGYYRWELPAEDLRRMSLQAVPNLTVRERVGFIHNAAALLRAGSLHGDEFLDILSPFAADPAPEVVEAVLFQIESLRAPFVTVELEELYARYVRLTLGPALDRFGRSRIDGEAEAVSLVRRSLLGVLGELGRDPRVLDYADSLADAYCAEPASVDPSLGAVALWLSALRGDRARLERYIKEFEAARDPTDRRRFLDALGGFREPDLVLDALRYVLVGPLRPQELPRIPTAIGTSPRFQDRVFEWVRENYGTIARRIPPLFAPFLASYCGGCSRERLEAGRSFFGDPSRAAPGTVKEIEKVSAAVNDCAGLREREGARVRAYLERRVGNP